MTPVMEKVNQTIGGDGLPTHRIEIVDWAWNQQIDLADDNAFYTWEFDTDTSKIEPVDLVSDRPILNFGFGAFGAVTRGGNPAPAGRLLGVRGPGPLQREQRLRAATTRTASRAARPDLQPAERLSVNGTVGGQQPQRSRRLLLRDQSMPIDADPVTPVSRTAAPTSVSRA